MNRSSFSQQQRQGAALVMTMITMLVLVIVLMISSQFTLKSMRTVKDQSTTVDAQYVGEAGLAWAKAYNKQLDKRFKDLPESGKTNAEFLNLLGQVCSGLYYTTSTGGCTVDTTSTTKMQAIADFFRTWDSGSPNDGLWTKAFTTSTHTFPLGDGRSYSLYNTYNVTTTTPGGVSSTTTVKRPLFAISRMEWDVKTVQGVNLMDAYRFCYDVGYYVSEGTSTGSGKRIVGLRPAPNTSTTSSGTTKCAATVSSGSSSTSPTGVDPERNFIEVDVEGGVTQAQITTTDWNKLAKAVTVKQVPEYTNTTTKVTYRFCGQTSQPSNSCGDRWYYFTYDALANTLNCWQGSTTPDSNINHTNLEANKLYGCEVDDQGESSTGTIMFVLSNTTPYKKLSIIVQQKTNGNDRVGSNDETNVTHDLITTMYHTGQCVGANMNTGFCTGNTTFDELNADLSNTTKFPPTIVPPTFTPASTGYDLLLEGKWVQLSAGDL